MKFTVCLVLALVVCSTMGLKAKKMTSTQVNRMAEIKKGNSWASILLNLAELHMTARGPLDELVQAIEDTINDLGYKREKRDAAYVKRTEEHEALVQQLTSDIARCEQDIADIENMLEMLAEQKAQLEEENANLSAMIKQTGVAMEEATRVRAKQHDEYETKVVETEQAIAAVEECLDILNEFAYGGASFVQIKNAKAKITDAQSKLAKTKSTEVTILNALVQVTMTQEFADHGAVVNVINKFNDIKNSLYDSRNKLDADEGIAQQQFEQFISDSKQTIYDCEETIAYNVGLLEENAANTAENQALLAQVRIDKANFEQALQDENDSFDLATQMYEDWCAENDREIAVCGEALEVVSTVDMADYISDRVNAEDGLVSSGMATTQQHGMGTEVFNFDYQF